MQRTPFSPITAELDHSACTDEPALKSVFKCIWSSSLVSVVSKCAVLSLISTTISRRTCPNTARQTVCVCLHTCHVCHPSVGLPFLTLVDSKIGQEGSYYLTVLCTLPVPGSGHHHAKRAEVCPSFGGIIQHIHAHGWL